MQFLVIGPPRSAEGHLLLPASQPGCCERICNRGPCLGPIPAIPGKHERSAPPPHTATVQPPAHLSLSLSAPRRSPPLTGATTTTTTTTTTEGRGAALAGIFVLSQTEKTAAKQNAPRIRRQGRPPPAGPPDADALPRLCRRWRPSPPPPLPPPPPPLLRSPAASSRPLLVVPGLPRLGGRRDL